MRFVANENIPGAVVHALRGGAHDVVWVKEWRPGADDRDVLALAQTEQRIVLTSDTDFGELAFRSRLPASSGVILVRLDWASPTADNAVVINALLSRDDWSGTFAVIERDRVRIRALPDAGTASASE